MTSSKIGVDTAANEPLEVWRENSIQYSLHSLVAGRIAAELSGRAAERALCQDDFFRFDLFGRDDDCPMLQGPSGARWKNWESVEGYVLFLIPS